jgi:hypothetical protein
MKMDISKGSLDLYSRQKLVMSADVKAQITLKQQDQDGAVSERLIKAVHVTSGSAHDTRFVIQNECILTDTVEDLSNMSLQIQD